MTKDTLLITGAARGIGYAAACTAIAAGHRVVAHCRTPSDRLSQLQTDNSDSCAIVTCDLADAQARKDLWQGACIPFGPPKGLLNNAGTMPSTPLDSSDADWDRDWAHVLGVNTAAVADLCRSAILSWQAGGDAGCGATARGRIVTIASRASFRGDTPDALHYAASKGAVVSLMRSLARAYAGDSIYSFLIAPGWVDTDMAATAHLPENAWMLSEIPTGRMASPESIAKTALFLFSGAVDDATGCTIDINGASYVR